MVITVKKNNFLPSLPMLVRISSFDDFVLNCFTACACVHGNNWSLYMCLKCHVVNVHAQDDDFATSPLGMACRKNQLEVVKVLIENGVMVNYRDKVCLDSIVHIAMAIHTITAVCMYLCVLIGWMDVSSPCY